MLRFILALLFGFLILSFLRAVLRLVGALFTTVSQPEKPAAQQRPSSTHLGGELVKDPVCGVYVSPAVAIKKTVRGETYHFCSEACRDKFA